MRQFDLLAQTQLAHQQFRTTAHLERTLLIREALAGRQDRDHFVRPLLIGVGRRLEQFGVGLQARYSVNLEIGSSSPAPSSALAGDTGC